MGERAADDGKNVGPTRALPRKFVAPANARTGFDGIISGAKRWWSDADDVEASKTGVVLLLA